MKQIKFRIITGLISLLFIAACFLNNGLTVSATSTSDSLHTQTKIYSSNNDDYFDGCEDYDDSLLMASNINLRVEKKDWA